MDRRRAGNPGRHGYMPDVPLPANDEVISDRNLSAVDYSRMRRGNVRTHQGQNREVRGRDAVFWSNDFLAAPAMEDPAFTMDRSRPSRLKKGGPVKASPKTKPKPKASRSTPK
jgi:hypothetical protein